MANNSSPTGGNILRQSRQEVMAVFDSLPPEVRRWIANADIPYSTTWANAAEIKRDPAKALATIMKNDFAKRARRIRAAWGPDHPEYIELTQVLL